MVARRYSLPVLIGTVLIAASPAQAAQRVASVRFIVHGLTVMPPNRATADGRVGDPLFTAYGLRTAAQQKASIQFVDKTTLHINQRTALVLRSPNLTVLQRGEVSAVDTPGSNHKIQTASAVASAVGTVYDVRIARKPSSSAYGTPTPQKFPPGTTTVSVVQGTVNVSNALGRVSVRAGEWTHVAPGKAPTTPTRHNARGDVGWTTGLP